MTAVPPRWYCVSRHGYATKCADEADARANADEANRLYRHNAPYVAVLLGDVAAERAEIERLREALEKARGAQEAPASDKEKA